jgi:protein-disulfide isomerase
VKAYGDQIRVAYKHMPILSPESKTAAQYMEALAMQDKAKSLEFHDKVLGDQAALREGGEKFLDKIVKEVGADLARVKKDAKSETVRKRLEADLEEAQKYEFGGTPGFAVNGADIHGAYPTEFFKKVIDHVVSGK